MTVPTKQDINVILDIYDEEKCLKCGEDRIEIKVRKNYMKMIGKKTPKGNMKVKITKCGCNEYLKLYSSENKHCAEWPE